MNFNDTVTVELPRETVLSIITSREPTPFRESLLEQIQVPTEATLSQRQVMEMVDALRHSSSQREFRASLMALVETPPLRCPRTFPHKTCGPFENAEELAGHLRVHYRGSDETFDPEIALANAQAAEAAWLGGIDKAKARQANVVAGRHPDNDENAAYEVEEEDDDE